MTAKGSISSAGTHWTTSYKLKHAASQSMNRSMFPIPMDRQDGEMVITKRPWLAHCEAMIQANASYREAPLVLFRAADLNHGEFIDLVEFAALVVVLAVGFDPKVDKGELALFLFRMFDTIRDGFLDEEEVDEFLSMTKNAGIDLRLGSGLRKMQGESQCI
jgi:hypothetical protein